MFRNLLALSILALGASAVVLSPAHDARNLGMTRHRSLSRSVVPRTLAERRFLRQKRCDERFRSMESGSTQPAQSTEAPVNVAPPLPAPTTVVPDPAPPAPVPDVPAPPPSNDNNNNYNPPPPSDPAPGGEQFSGQLTWFNVGLGSCGGFNVDTDYIAAASYLLYDNFEGYGGGNPNFNPICGKQAQISFEGKTVTVSIQDRCPVCAYGDLDLSPAAFAAIADPGRGRLDGATWRFV